MFNIPDGTREDLAEIAKIKEKSNLFDIGAYTDNNFINSDGSIVSNTGYYYTDYIEVSIGDVLVIRDNQPELLGANYDEDKVFIDAIAGVSSAGVPITTHVEQISHAGYVRFNGQKSRIDTFDYILIKDADAEIEFNYIWMINGDSISDDNVHTTSHYYDQIAENLGLTVLNEAKDGIGYEVSYSANVAFVDAITSLSTDIGQLSVFLGHNDYLSGTLALGSIGDTDKLVSLCGVIYDCFDQLATKYPSKNIMILTPIPITASNTKEQTVNTQGYSLKELADAIIGIANIFGFPCKDLFNSGGIMPYDDYYASKYYADGTLHPNDLLHYEIANKLESFIRDNGVFNKLKDT